METPNKKYNRGKKRFSIGIKVLTLLLVLLIAAVLVYINVIQKEKEIPLNGVELPFKTLYKYTQRQTSQISVKLNGEVNYKIVKNKDEDNQYVAFFSDEKDKLFKIDTAVADEILGYTQTIGVENTVAEKEENTPPLDEMGLDDPTITINVIYDDGSTNTMYVGDVVSGTGYRYFMLEGDKKAYMVNEGIYDIFSLTPDMMCKMEKPEILRTNIDRIEISKKGIADFGSTKSDKLEIMIDGFGTENIYGSIIKPFEYIIDSEKLFSLINATVSLKPGAFVCKQNQEMLDDYGFNDANTLKLTVHTKEGTTIQTDEFENSGISKYVVSPSQSIYVYFGKKADEYSVYMLYNESIYKINVLTTAPILETSLEYLLADKPLDIQKSDITTLTINKAKANEVQYLITNDNQVSTDSEKTDNRYITKNGKVFDNSVYDEIINRISSLQTNTFLSDVQTNFDSEPYVSLDINRKDKEKITLACYQYDEFSDIVALNGVAIASWVRENTDRLEDY